MFRNRPLLSSDRLTVVARPPTYSWPWLPLPLARSKRKSKLFLAAYRLARLMNSLPFISVA